MGEADLALSGAGSRWMGRIDALGIGGTRSDAVAEEARVDDMDRGDATADGTYVLCVRGSPPQAWLQARQGSDREVNRS